MFLVYTQLNDAFINSGTPLMYVCVCVIKTTINTKDFIPNFIIVSDVNIYI